jgi:hypothetical protein
MTLDEATKLLREARKLLSLECWSGTCCALRREIDAALAEPAPDAALEVAEVPPPVWNNDERFICWLDGAELRVVRTGFVSPHPWGWDAFRVGEGSLGCGTCATLEEAKAAAVEAARRKK